MRNGHDIVKMNSSTFNITILLHVQRMKQEATKLLHKKWLETSAQRSSTSNVKQ